MTNEPKPKPETPTVPDVVPKEEHLITDETDLATNPPKEPIKEETLALIEALRTKAQSEAQKAGDFARDNYLEAVRRARTEVEKLNLFEPNRIEDAIKQLQGEVEKDWDTLVKQVADVGDRLNEAAKAAWEKLTAPTAEKKQSDSDSGN